MTTQYAFIEDVKAWLHIDSPDEDALLDRMISAASSWIASYLSREIASAPHTVVVDGNGSRRMCLAHTPIQSITSVTINGVLLDQSLVRADDFGAVLTAGYSFSKGIANVEISYTGGFATVPDDIVQCCIDIVAFNYRRRERIGHSSKSIQGETVAFVTADVPPEVKQVLKQYRRVVPL